jgi:hypothetical protein
VVEGLLSGKAPNTLDKDNSPFVFWP